MAIDRMIEERRLQRVNQAREWAGLGSLVEGVDLRVSPNQLFHGRHWIQDGAVANAAAAERPGPRADFQAISNIPEDRFPQRALAVNAEHIVFLYLLTYF
jgi:hypothetical protein